jgi:hypothetical protein
MEVLEVINGVAVLLLAIACVVVAVQLNEARRLRDLVESERRSAMEWQRIAYRQKVCLTRRQAAVQG